MAERRLQRSATPRAPGGSTSWPPTSTSRTSGPCRRRVRRGLPALVRGATGFETLGKLLAGGAGAVGAALEARRDLRLGRRGRGRGCRACATAYRGPARNGAVQKPSLPSSPSTCSTTSMRRARERDRARRHASRLGPGPDGRYRGQMAVLVKRNGLRGRLHGRDRAVPISDRLPDMIREIERDWPSRPPSSQRWVVLYDSDCGFCIWLLAGLLRGTVTRACDRSARGAVRQRVSSRTSTRRADGLLASDRPRRRP